MDYRTMIALLEIALMSGAGCAGSGRCIASQEGRSYPEVLELVSLVGGALGTVSGGDQYLRGAQPQWRIEETESELHSPASLRAFGLCHFWNALLDKVEPRPRNWKSMEPVYNWAGVSNGRQLLIESLISGTFKHEGAEHLSKFDPPLHHRCACNFWWGLWWPQEFKPCNFWEIVANFNESVTNTCTSFFVCHFTLGGRQPHLLQTLT